MTRDDIRFIFRGKPVSLRHVSTQRTVLDWLREDQKATGTKEGCNEGDCGACTVAIASLDARSPGGVRIQAVNSCIQFLPTLDGKALFTVEDLTSDGSLHPVQQAMVDHHGSQCGFCTPGFVMSLWADYETRADSPGLADLRELLSGNLCRCTGYRPIFDAAEAARRYPRVMIDRVALRQKLQELADLPALDYRHQSQRFIAPKTTDDLAAALASHPQALILAGSTDIGIWATKQLRNLETLIYVGKVAGFREIGRDQTGLTIGAGASLTDCFAALVESDPAWGELAQRFASHPVRNAGTLGGNVANGSPIGDSMPPLIALGARVNLRKGIETRSLSLEDLYLGYRKTALQAGEFIASVWVPRRETGSFFRVWKVSKRRDQDISAVCGAFKVKLNGQGEMTNVRVAFGGVAAIPLRCRQVEASLEGQVPTPASLSAAISALSKDFTPLDDMRASAAYRTQVAGNLLKRLFLELRGDQATIKLQEVQA